MKVLVVDDDLNMRIFISILLETSGYIPVVSRDGNEGILKATETSPSLIILDLMMPGKGGILTYQQLKEDEKLKSIPVIILSGVESKTFYHSLNVLNAGREVKLPGPSAYLEKPPQPEKLRGLIEAILRNGNT